MLYQLSYARVVGNSSPAEERGRRRSVALGSDRRPSVG